MHLFRSIMFCMTILGSTSSALGQTVNWRSLDSTRHILNAGIDLDYGLVYGLGYGYHLDSDLPIIFQGNLSVASGEELFDDLKLRLGMQTLLLNHKNVKGSITVHGIYRTYRNPLVQFNNFGCEIKGAIGLYKVKWFLAIEAGFDKAIVTHFDHAESFRQNIFPEVKDGWYEPPTGGNFAFGFQSGYSFDTSDFTVNIGRFFNEDLKSGPLIPYYLTIGYHVRI